MPIPGQTITVQDPGLGTVEPATSIPLFYGPTSLGTNNVIATYSSLPALVAGHGQGSAVEAAAYVLANGGGPVRVMKAATSVAASNGAVTATRVGTSTGTVTVAGTALDDYEVIVRIATTGTVGTGAFEYSLDDGYTYSERLTIPAGATYLMPNTGLTLTFVPGAGAVFFEAGDRHEFDAVAAMWNATDMAAAITALLADSTAWDFMVACGRHATAAGAATIAAAAETHMNSFAAVNRFVRVMMDAGKDTTATTLAALAATTGRRIGLTYGTMDVASAKPFVGWAVPMRASLNAFALRATKGLISTDLARGIDGLPGVVAIGHDEYKTEVMDAGKISTLRTYPNATGFFPTNMRLKSPVGSDFQYWQHGRVMDAACKTVVQAQQMFLNTGVRTTATGTIDPRDAIRIESHVTAKLRAVLSEPVNAEGFQGHVTALSYTVRLDNNIQATGQLLTNLAARPLGYVKNADAVVGFALAVAA